MKAEILEAIQAARTAKRATALLTDLEAGAETLVVDGEVAIHGVAVTRDLLDAVGEAARADRSCVVETGGRRWLVRVFSPPLRLFIIGAVHIAQSLATMAKETGYAVTLIDPRDAWASEARFPEIEIDRRWPAEALADLEIDRRTAVVALSHDPKVDEPALAAALRSQAFYIGALGSRRTHARRLERLREAGFDDAQLAAIHGPVGLDIGAISPAEIAVSILAQMTQRLRA